MQYKNNTIKRRTIDRYIVDLIIILEAFFIFTSYFLTKSVTKYFLISIVVFSFILGISLILKSPILLKSEKKIFLAYYTLIISTILYSVFLRNSISSALIFLAGIVYLVFIYKRGLDKRNIYLLLICNLLLVVIHFYNIQAPEAYSNVSNTLVGAYENSNMTGIVISASIFILVTGLFIVKKKLNKLILLIFILVALYLLITTNNRGSILAIAVFLALVFYNWNKNKEIKKLRILILLFPVLFLFIYSGIIISISSDISIFGKPFFSGRELEWKNLINKIISDPLNIYKLPMGGLNFIIAGLIEFGIISIALYGYIIFKASPQINYNSKTQFQQIAYLAFLCVFIQQTFESTIINGAYGVYIYSYSLLGIASSTYDNSIRIYLNNSKR
jgi:hypothetical protein